MMYQTPKSDLTILGVSSFPSGVNQAPYLIREILTPTSP